MQPSRSATVLSLHHCIGAANQSTATTDVGGMSCGLMSHTCHLLTLSQERPFACDSCSVRFHRLRDLQRHQKLHTRERPFRKFARADELSRHKRTVCERTKKYSEGEDDKDFVGDAVKEHHAAATSGEERVQGALPSTDVDIEMEEEASPFSVSRKRNREEDEFMESISKRPRTDGHII